jgi:hypothetical protein
MVGLFIYILGHTLKVFVYNGYDTICHFGVLDVYGELF